MTLKNALNPDYPLTKLRIARILEALKVRDMSGFQIADAMHICRENARKYVVLLLELKLAHVQRWEQTEGKRRYMPILRAGRGKDAPRPVKMTNTERARKYRIELKKDRDRYERIAATQNAQIRKIPPDPLLAWIPVRAAQ